MKIFKYFFPLFLLSCSSKNNLDDAKIYDAGSERLEEVSDSSADAAESEVSEVGPKVYKNQFNLKIDGIEKPTIGDKSYVLSDSLHVSTYINLPTPTTSFLNGLTLSVPPYEGNYDCDGDKIFMMYVIITDADPIIMKTKAGTCKISIEKLGSLGEYVSGKFFATSYNFFDSTDATVTELSGDFNVIRTELK